MFTTAMGALNGISYLNSAFDTGWLPAEEEDSTSTTLKKLETWTKSDSLTIAITGDRTSRYKPGMKIKLDQDGVTKYFTVLLVSYLNPYTNLTLDGYGVYTLSDSAITNCYYSILINPIGWPESWGLADIGGWTSGLTAVYVSSNEIKIEGLDVTDRIQQGTKIRYKQGGEYKYDFVSEINFATDSVLTLLGGSTVEDLPITDFAYSNIANPIGWPFGVNYIQGTNENGTWRKWADGTLECWETKTFTSVAVTTLWGAGIYLSPPEIVTWPISFTVIASVNINVIARTPANFVPISVEAAELYLGYFYFWKPVSCTYDSITVGFCAKGRWK